MKKVTICNILYCINDNYISNTLMHSADISMSFLMHKRIMLNVNVHNRMKRSTWEWTTAIASTSIKKSWVLPAGNINVRWGSLGVKSIDCPPVSLRAKILICECFDPTVVFSPSPHIAFSAESGDLEFTLGNGNLKIKYWYIS